MMNEERPDYFAAAPSVEDAVLRRIKGNFRRRMAFESLMTGDLESIPEPWRAHNISEDLKSALTSSHGPQGRGGEDLPDLEQDEVEIARLSLVDGVHGEVTSLRAKLDPRDLIISLSMVDEYGTQFALPVQNVPVALTAEEVLVAFRDADPTPTDTSCQIEFTSYFYPRLDSLATAMGIKSATADSSETGAQATSETQDKRVKGEEIIATYEDVLARSGVRIPKAHNGTSEAIESLEDMVATTTILINSLSASDEEKSNDGITGLLMQGLTQFGHESVAMQQFFPVFDTIKRRIDASDLPGALGQARLFQSQIKEIISLTRSGTKGRILLVNDQESVFGLMKEILMKDGYEVRSTCGQSDPIGRAKAFEPQVVMLGVTTPVALGSEFFALGSKIVLYGEVDESEDLEGRRDYYDFDLLPTPFDGQRLLNYMRSCMAEAWTSKGSSLAVRDHLEALQFHEKALTIDPLHVSAWLNKGYSLDELGRWHEAIESYDRAIEINASDWIPHVRKGDILDRVGQYEQAILCFDSALAISKNIVSGWMGRGEALHHLGRYEEALLSYDKVFDVDHPTWTASGRAHVHSDAWNCKGTSLYRMGRYQESIECYEKAIAIDPKFEFAWYNKANSLREMTNFDDAIRCYDSAIELFSEHARSWNNKGVCLSKMDRLEEALACHEKAVTCDPSEVIGWYNKALILDDLKRAEDAIHSYQKYITVAPSDQVDNVRHAQERLRHLRSRGC